MAIHDLPLLGIFTTAFVDGFTGLIWSPPSEAELRQAFDAADARKAGKLDRTGVADALRVLGKSERQVQKLVDYMLSDELDFPAFSELVVPSALPWSYTVGGVLPLPNHEKIFDTPVLGNILQVTNDTLAQPFDNTLRTWRSSTYPPSDHRMASIFKEVGVAPGSRLSKSDVPQAMRKFFKTEAEIRATLDAISADISLYEFKKLVRGPKYSPSVVNRVPMVGPALSANVLSAFEDEVEEGDQREAFEFLDKQQTGRLDKTEVAELLRELGKSELEVQKLVDSLPHEEVDFAGFKELMRNGASRALTTSVSGYLVPNPAKIHDVPLLGSCTMLTQDILVDTYSWTAGPAFRYLAPPTSDTALRDCFLAHAAQSPGSLTRREVGRGLRSLGFSEAEIKSRCDGLSEGNLSLEEFKNLVRCGHTVQESQGESHPLRILGLHLTRSMTSSEASP